MAEIHDITKPIELDYLYNAADKLYMQFARRCGISTCAYWMLYDLVRAEDTSSLTDLNDSWSYSKQTINSALKSLEARGLIERAFVEGSRRNKRATLTEAGRDFAARNILPAMQAEERAFRMLSERERAQLLTLTRKYARALEAEFASMHGKADRPADAEGKGAA